MFDALEMTPSAQLTPDFLEEGLKAGRYDEAWGKGTRPRKRAAIRKARKVFKRSGYFSSDEEIPTSRLELDFFAARYLSTNELARQAGLEDAEEAAKWAKEYGTVLDVASGFRDAKEALRKNEDDWADLLGNLTGKFGGPVVYGTYKMIPICSLVMRCRERGVGIAELTADVVNEICLELPRSKRNSMRAAISRLHRLRGTNYVPFELLPCVAPADLAPIQGACVRVVPDLNPAFEALARSFLSQAASGKIKVMFGVRVRDIPTEKKGEARLKNIADALRWMWHGLVALEFADRETFDATCLSDANFLVDLIEACADGKLGPISSSQTRRDRVLALISFLDWHQPGFRLGIPSGFYKHDAIRRTTGEDTEDKRKKRTACQDFVNDGRLQRQYFPMPKTFYDEAKPIVDISALRDRFRASWPKRRCSASLA